MIQKDIVYILVDSFYIVTMFCRNRNVELHLDLPPGRLSGESVSAWIKRSQSEQASKALVKKPEPGQAVAFDNNARMDGVVAATDTVGEKP